MKKKTRKQERTVPPEAGEPPERHQQSPTAIAAEALSTGVPPPAVARPDDEDEVPGEAELLRVGDDEVDPLQNAYVGDEAPGGDMPTPDQDLVDEIGRAYGVPEADSGTLRTSSELLDARDRHRAELEAPRPPHGTRDSDRERNR